MHLYFMVRGVIHQLNLFEMFMSTQMFPWKRKNLKTGKDEYIQVQGGLRRAPWGYEYVFPEECLAEVLTMLEIMPKDNRWDLGSVKSWVIRKALGKGDAGHKVLPIPKYKPVLTTRYIEKRGIAIYPIGIKKDARQKMEEWGYEQEML